MNLKLKRKTGKMDFELEICTKSSNAISQKFELSKLLWDLGTWFTIINYVIFPLVKQLLILLATL